jgi:DNA-binding IclR family transcriptional regulator
MTTAANTAQPAPKVGAKTRIQSVARASRILLWVANQPHGATAKEVATSQGLAVPTTYHLLNTLLDEGLLAKDVRGHYILGRSSAILAQNYLRGKSVPDSLLRGLRGLAVRTGETGYLADWGEHDIRVLASVEGRQIVRVAEVASGPYEHGHARANGKVLLAFARPELRQAYLRSHPLVPVTPTTISDPQSFERELERIVQRGFGYDEEEYAAGVSCLAAPVLHHGQLVAALGLAVPTERFTQRRAELTAALLEVTHGLQEDGSIAPPDPAAGPDVP